ncbi:MAG: hypothetical protein IPP71_14185 [Bacteroidetes bacterium]|nr:hypothetical protein [Bacteroidota bacterium]
MENQRHHQAIEGRKLEIAFANHSTFKGDISIAGLPDFQESFFDLVVNELITDKGEIETIPDYPFNRGKKMELPVELSKLGKVHFSGKFTGFLNDFVAYGNANTAIGYVSSDINLKIDSVADKSSFSGHLSATSFDVGTLIDNKALLGKTTFKSNVSGRGFAFDKLKAQMEGEISSLELNGYNYKNIIVNGQFAKRLFNGSLKVEEENLGLDFKGTIDLSHKIPVYDFTTEIKNAYLAKLKLIKRDTTAVLSTKADIRITGKDFDDLTGYIKIKGTRYIEYNDTIKVDSISFVSYSEGSQKISNLRSDIIDLDSKGTFKRTTMASDIGELFSTYIPTLAATKSTNKNNLAITF